MAEHRGQGPRHPLTADLAGVLAAAQHERHWRMGGMQRRGALVQPVLRFAQRAWLAVPSCGVPFEQTAALLFAVPACPRSP